MRYPIGASATVEELTGDPHPLLARLRATEPVSWLPALDGWLVTSHGLRSLAPGDPAYQGTFAGDRRARDGAYHQGTVWTWLLPHFAIAHERVYGDRATALGFLEPMGRLLAAMGVGTLPEVADGDPPHAPRGCLAQAWSVAEVLRAYHALSSEPKRPRRRNVPRTAMAMAR